MNDQEFIERMKHAKSKVKDGLFTPIVDMLPEDREYASVKLSDKGTMTKNKHNAIFFDDLRREAQKRIIIIELFNTLDAVDSIFVTLTIEKDFYGYDEDPKKQTLEQHIHARIIMDGEEHRWLMVWNCFDHKFNTIMREDQKDEAK